MKQPYYLFVRSKKNGIWHFRDSANPKIKGSLGTTNKAEARKLADARYEHRKDLDHNTQMAQVYLRKLDPTRATRTWDNVFDTKIASVKGSTQKRWERHKKSKAFNSIRNIVVTQTQSDNLRHILFAKGAKVSTIKCLMELHKFALDNGYLLAPILPKAQWPDIQHGETRAITEAEHQKILAREPNEERKKFYQLCWFLGWSQSDVATALASDIDWKDKTIVKDRMKTGVLGGQQFGEELEAILKTLSQSGFLFPYLATVRECDRATEFRQRCESVGIVDKALKLHSYRYGLAERMADLGYPERDAMKVLGQNSKAVHRAYARHAFRNIQVPTLEKAAKDKTEVELLKAQLAAMEKQLAALQPAA